MVPKISVVVAFKNPGSIFELAIQSVFAQTFNDWELLLVDDGSIDGSLEFARAIDDKRVFVFSDGVSLGLSRRLNQLIDLAKAPYIFRMDADDIMHPDRIAEQYKILTENHNRTVVGSSAFIIDENSRVVGIRSMCNAHLSGFAATGSFIHPTVAASAEWFKFYRYSEDPSFFRSEDAELWFRSSADSRFINIEQPLLFYRETGRNPLEKYAGSTLGTILIARRLAGTSRVKALYVISNKIIKLWIMCIADITGRTRGIINNRNKAASSCNLATAECIIEQIKSKPLPILTRSCSRENSRNEVASYIAETRTEELIPEMTFVTP